MSWCRSVEDGVEVEVLAVPRAARSQVVGVHDDRLKVQLCAPPVDGAANEALVELLAKLLKIKKSAVSLVAGHTGRRKRVRLQGVRPEDAQRLL